MTVDERIEELGLTLPAPIQLPSGVQTNFSWVRLDGSRVLVSGHGPTDRDGAPAGPFGRVPDQVSLEAAQDSARRTALAVMASVRAAVGGLDRVAAWLTVTGFVQAEPGFTGTTAVLNAFSDVVLGIFGQKVGEHARTAIGVAALPLNLPVVVSAELRLTD